MATLADLLADPSARIEVVCSIAYLSSSNVESIEWICQGNQGRGWADPPSGPVAAYIPPLLATGLQISQHIDPLNPSEAFGTYSQLELINDVREYAGHWDAWIHNSIDNRLIQIYLVGILSSGTRVNLSDVLTSPLFSLRGIGVPEVGDAKAIISVRDDSHSLDQPLQPVTYSPSCLYFPGTSSGTVDLGDNLDQTSSFSLAGWVNLDDPTIANQFLFFKDSAGSTGYVFDAGVALGMTIRGQTPSPLTSIASPLHARQWHYLSFSVNTAAGTREIGVDGVSVVSSSSIAGSPSANSISLTMGKGLKGKLSRWTYWNSAKTVAAMYAESRQPVLPSASGLLAYFPGDEGVGSTIHDRKSGSALTGTADASVTWDTASWAWQSIAGNFRPYVLGTVSRVPVSWVDPVNQIGEVSYGGAALISEVQSGHNALGAIWTPNLAAGTFQITSGALSGTYSATVTGNNFWNSALSIISTSTVLATINSVNGSCTLTCQYTPSKSHTGASYVLMGWQTSASAGSIILRLKSTGGANCLEAFCINDAGTIFTTSSGPNLSEGTTYSLALVRNMNQAGNTATTGATLAVWVNGTLSSAVVTITGTFSTTRTAFGIGCRPDSTTGTQAEGRYDEPLVFARALSQSDLQALHMLPATGSEANLAYGWHCDDATGSSASSMLGGTALTLTNVTWTGGRSTAADLARKCYYLAGYLAADLDSMTWRACLNANPSDCGWYVGQGETALEISRIILGGLGFIPYKTGSTIYIKQFVGVTGTPDATYSINRDVQSGEITPESHDPAVWQWTVLYAHNDSKMDPANIAGALAMSDPDRYLYGSMLDRPAVKQDYSIKATATGAAGRYPTAISKIRQTALINRRDAMTEAARLLALHRYASDTKGIPLWILAGSRSILHEAAFDVEEAELNLSDWVVIGLEIVDDVATVTIWRPAKQAYPIP